MYIRHIEYKPRTDLYTIIEEMKDPTTVTSTLSLFIFTKGVSISF